MPFNMELNLHLAQEPEKPDKDLAGAAGTIGGDFTPRLCVSNNVYRLQGTSLRTLTF